MEGDRLSGVLALLIFKPGTRRMCVVRLSALPLYCQRKSWGWRLGGCWSWSGCFGEEVVLLLVPRFEQ